MKKVIDLLIMLVGIATAAAPPVLISPINGATGVSCAYYYNPKIVTLPGASVIGASSYIIQISTSSAFAQPTSVCSIPTSNGFIVCSNLYVTGITTTSYQDASLPCDVTIANDINKIT